MQTATIILTDPRTGTQNAYELDVTKAGPAPLPEGLVGPFLMSFEMEDETNHKDLFDATIWLNSKRCVAMLRRMPILAKFNAAPCINIKGKPCKPVMQENLGGYKIHLLALSVEELGASHVWFDIENGDVTAGSYCEKQKQAFPLPYYNFYNQLTMCMGGLNLSPGKPLKALYQLLSSLTTPHLTWSGAQHSQWNHDLDKRTITANEKLKLTRADIDLPDVSIKPIARISP